MLRLAPPCLIALSLLACASPAPQPQTATPAPTPTAAPPRPVAQVGRADQIAVTALRIAAVDRDGGRAIAAMKEATAAAPDRADLARLALQFCLNTQGCEPEPYETRLRKLDPGNGVVWLGVLARTTQRRDPQAEQQILQTLGQAQRVDLYWNTLLWRLAAALPAPAPTPTGPNLPLTTALNDVTQWLATAAVPSFQAVTTLCAPERVRDSNGKSRCLRVAQALQKGDTALVEGIGLGVAQRLTDIGTPAWNSVQQRIDALAYQTEAAGAIIRSQVERERFSAEMVELLKQLPREQDVSLAILRWAGQPVGNRPVGR